MSPKARRQFTTAQKVAILRRHFVDKVAISEICAEYNFNLVSSSLGGLVRGIDWNLLHSVLAHPARAAEFDDYPEPQAVLRSPGVMDSMPDGTVIISENLLNGARRVQ